MPADHEMKYKDESIKAGYKEQNPQRSDLSQ